MHYLWGISPRFSATRSPTNAGGLGSDLHRYLGTLLEVLRFARTILDFPHWRYSPI